MENLQNLPELHPKDLSEEDRFTRFQGANYVFEAALSKKLVGRAPAAANENLFVALPSLKDYALTMLAGDANIREVRIFRTRDWKLLATEKR